MPGPDADSFADELINEADSFADELLGEVEADPLGTPQEAADYAKNEEAARPTQLGGGVPLQTPAADKPWYENLGDSIKESPVASPLFSLLENAGAGATSQTTDEMGAAMMDPNTQASAMERPDRNQGYTGIGLQEEEIPREYAAGSQFEDNRQTLEREMLERNEENPKSALAGQVVGGVAQGAALPYQGVVGSTLSAAGQGAAQLMGSGSGDLGDRAEQASEFVQEHPVASAVAVGLPAAAGGVQKLAGAGAQAMRGKQYANRVAAVTTPQQRTAIAANKGGQQAVVNLGRDIEEQGLHKTPWYQFWAPNAETYYNNASKARIAANEAMSSAEDKIVELGNPQIEVGSIADDLDASARDVSGMMDAETAAKEMTARQKLASGIRNATKVQPEGPPELQIPENTAYGPAPEPTLQFPEPVETGKVPFDVALKNRRYFDKNIDHLRRGGPEDAPMQEEVRRQVANQLRRNIGDGLEQAGESGQIDKGLIDTWNKAKKKYSVAAAVEDPALAKMQGDYGGTFGLRDMAAAGVAGLSGPGALVGAKMMQGRMPSVWAGTQSKVATGLEALESSSSPNAAAAVTRPVAEQNQNLKKEVQEAQKKGGNSWFEDFLSMF